MREALVPKDPALASSAKTFSAAIAALGTVWTSGCTAARFDPVYRRMVVEGDLVEQARIALDKIKAALSAGDLALRSVSAMVQYLTPAALDEIEPLQAFYRDAFEGRVPLVNTIVVKRLLRETAVIEIEAIAGQRPELALEYLPAVSAVETDAARAGVERLLAARRLTWSDLAKQTEFVASGRTGALHARGRREEGLQVVMPRVIEAGAGSQIQAAVRRSDRILVMSAYGEATAGGVVEQCRAIYSDLAERLARAGSGLGAVVKTTEFVTSAALAAYRGTAEVRRQIFAAPYPAATGVVCESLGEPDSQIAVEVIAVSDRT
ncbi:MAG TPA: RidA family protein [Burkholderiales bacterium]|nr:RidA family protein [Burkholderiales bacterium]